MALTCWTGVTGGGRLEFGALELSVRDWRRPAALALFAAMWLLWRTPREERLPAFARVALLALLLAVPATSLTYLVAAAGGLDSHGYVSAGNLMAGGGLRRQVEAGWLPIAAPLQALAPLGYVAGADGASVVPRYPPGFPAVIALFQLVLGRPAVFYAVPVLAIATLILVWRLLRQISTPEAALFGAALVGLQPVFFTYSLQPMSDVPATFWLVLAATLVAVRGHPGLWLLAGLAAGGAILTRPTLGLAALAIPLVARDRTTRLHLAVFGAGLVPPVLALALVQWTLYGSPLASGYGGAGSLFGLDAIGANATVHTHWLWRLNTPLLPAGLALAWALGNRRFLLAALAIFAGGAIPYLLYTSFFDDWEVQRFLLPGLVFLVIAAADGLATASARFLPRRVMPLPMAALAWLLAAASLIFVGNRGVPQLAAAESKYPGVASWFSANAAAGDVVLAALHSGSVHYYSGRTTIRWDQVPGESLATVVQAIERRGAAAYLVLDGNDERGLFVERFGEAPGVRIDYVERIRTADIARVSLRR